jgi:hypothetical protein
MPERHCSRIPREQAPATDVGERDDFDDGMVLAILIDSDHPGLWAVDEISRVIGSPTTAGDTLMRLERDGLIHRLDRFVFPTRAAVRAGEVQI